MTRSGRMTDDLIPRVAQPYSGGGAGVQASYGDYFAAYSTALDIYAYDNALFGGRLVSPNMLARLFAPRAAIAPNAPTADPGISDLRFCYYWKTGGVFGHQAVYTRNGTGSFSTVNMRFPRDGVTIVVNSNDDTNQVERIAVHLAGIRFGR
jgi:hypothetical protein